MGYPSWPLYMLGDSRYVRTKLKELRGVLTGGLRLVHGRPSHRTTTTGGDFGVPGILPGAVKWGK